MNLSLTGWWWFLVFLVLLQKKKKNKGIKLDMIELQLMILFYDDLFLLLG